MNSWLDAISNNMTQNVWLAPLVAVLAGMITSFTPCSLSSISLLIGYVGGYSENSTKKAFKYSLTFCMGMAITFAILGMAASLFGKLVHFEDKWLHI
ncbi:MAG: cytochrome c biogenesis protein CcdA, partial [Clostridia bacterium]|nr:cytochrome c biogenesis protein CcdA [Clostridia bacterium]